MTAGTVLNRYPAARTLRYAAGSPLPGAEECAALAHDGVAGAAVDGPLDLTRPEALDTLRFVRDCVAAGVRVDWSIERLGDVDPDTLTHLCPPSALPGHAALLADWNDFAFGVLYWRRGPGFAIVRDIRPAFERAVYTLEPDGTLEAFLRAQHPVAVDALSESERTGLAQLLEARLATTIGGVALALPYRIHKWPVPFMAV